MRPLQRTRPWGWEAAAFAAPRTLKHGHVTSERDTSPHLHHILCRAYTDTCTTQPHVGSPSFLLSFFQLSPSKTCVCSSRCLAPPLSSVVSVTGATAPPTSSLSSVLLVRITGPLFPRPLALPFRLCSFILCFACGWVGRTFGTGFTWPAAARPALFVCRYADGREDDSYMNDDWCSLLHEHSTQRRAG